MRRRILNSKIAISVLNRTLPTVFPHPHLCPTLQFEKCRTSIISSPRLSATFLVIGHALYNTSSPSYSPAHITCVRAVVAPSSLSPATLPHRQYSVPTAVAN